MNKMGLTSTLNSPITVVVATSLQKTFRMDGSSVEVLKCVDLVLEPGSSAAIVGPSGAGKSTLLHILGLLEKPTGGDYWFEGRDVSKLSEHEKADLRLRKIGFIFQFHHLMPEFTALENVMMPGLMLGKSKSETRSGAEIFLEQVGLKDRANHRPGELSGGEQQRVALARALVNSPSLILADEPTGNLDVESAAMTAALLKEISKRTNAALVLVTHNHKLAREMDTILSMEGGKLTTLTPSLDMIG